jgi:hypothetical protein
MSEIVRPVLRQPSRRSAPPVAAQGKRIETEAAPIRYVAELLGIDTDNEKAIRWPIALMVLCCDPLAIALTAAASARRWGLVSSGGGKQDGIGSPSGKESING